MFEASSSSSPESESPAVVLEAVVESTLPNLGEGIREAQVLEQLEQLEQLVGARQRPRAFSAPAHLGGTRCVSSPPSRPVQASSAAPGAGAADLV